MKMLQGVKRYFKDADAKGTFANMERGNRGQRHKQSRLHIIKKVKPERKTCLDAGCGWGRFIKDYILHNASLCVGVDINLKNLAKCKAIKGVNLVRADIENLPFRSNIFDLITSTGTMIHLPHPSKAMEEFKAATRKGGLVCVTWPHFNWLKALWNPYIRHRLKLALEDLLERYFKGFRRKHTSRKRGFSPRQVISLNKGLKLESFVRFNIMIGDLLVSIGKKE